MEMSEASVSERRQGQRLATCLPGKLIAAGQAYPIPCAVTEISPTGAKLRVSEKSMLRSSFRLRLDGCHQLHYCAVVWRSGQDVGVEFPSEHGSHWRESIGAWR
jgi:hypothetical protein